MPAVAPWHQGVTMHLVRASTPFPFGKFLGGNRPVAVSVDLLEALHHRFSELNLADTAILVEVIAAQETLAASTASATIACVAASAPASLIPIASVRVAPLVTIIVVCTATIVALIAIVVISVTTVISVSVVLPVIAAF
jgi:hypothetical protein